MTNRYHSKSSAELDHSVVVVDKISVLNEKINKDMKSSIEEKSEHEMTAEQA